MDYSQRWALADFDRFTAERKIALLINNLAHIEISAIEERIGQQVHNLLLDRFNSGGRPQKPFYTLTVRLALSTEEVGLKFTEEATRARLTMEVSYFLTENGSGKILTEGGVRSVNSYNISDSLFSRLASEENAKETRGPRSERRDQDTAKRLFFPTRRVRTL